jgi:hypothetical protein
MRPASLLLSLGVAALLLACQGPARKGSADDFPSNNPTTTSTDLADRAR